MGRSLALTWASISTLLLARAAEAVPPTPGVSQAECQQRAATLMEVVQKWSSAGHHVEWDTGAFYRCTTPPGTFQAMASHLKLEDSNNPRPLRSGAEVSFFNKLKNEIASLPPGQRIDQMRMLSLALDAVAGPNGTANLQAALLTVHNVVRMLARPLTWPAEPGPADPAYPIFLDLWGRGTSGGRTLGEVVHAARRASGQFDDRSFTLTRLFDNDRGVFPALTGATNTEWNGGSHYYFWIGALGEATLGTAATMGGLVGELRAKKGAGRGPQGEVEVSHFVCGSIFGSEAFKQRNGLLAPDPARPNRCAEAPAAGATVVLASVEYEVLDPSSREFVAGKSMKTPTSIWNIAGSAFQFHSDQDGFELRVEWGDMPATMQTMATHALEVRATIKSGKRNATVALTPVMNMAFWRMKLEDGTRGVDHPGVNAFRINLHGAPTAEEAAVTQGTMRVAITPVGLDAKVVAGEVVGGNGQLVRGNRSPGQFDAWFLELQINGMAKVRWTYVPVGSALLAK